MKKSSTTSQSAEQRAERIVTLQGYLLSDVYPAGMSRKDASLELMRLRNTRRKAATGGSKGEPE